MHQGSGLSLLPFAFFMEVISKELRVDFRWKLLCVDDLLVIG